MSNTNLLVAQEYAGRGWPVFPVWWVEDSRCACGKADCQHPAKHPIGQLAPNGRNSATPDSEVIKAWWGQYPQANIGILTGAESGLVVVDLDPRNGSEESWERLEQEHGSLTEVTPKAKTGGGGYHIFFEHPGPDHRIKSQSTLAGYEGIDLKADGGYVVAPPSQHISGTPYAWEITPDNTLASMPDWLKVLVATPPPQAPAARGEVIPQGQRNETLTRLAGAMRRPGMTQEAIETALLVENQRCDPPLSEHEVLTIAASVGRYPPEEEPEREQEAQPTQQEILLAIAAPAELFHTPDEECFACIPVNDHAANWPIRSRGFKRWLSFEFYKIVDRGPQTEQLSAALQVLEARAQFDAPERAVWVRVAEHEGNIYLDLGNPEWEAVRITPKGWEVIADPPVCFRRSRSMLPLPYPDRGGSINELRPFLNVASDSDFRLLVTFIIAALRARGPYPIVIKNGEQGTAKTTTARVIGSLIDPSTSPLRSVPREVRDLMVAAGNSWLMGYDNLSGIPDWISDALCRLSTGGGFSTRALYTDREETIFEAMRPITLNGIDSLANRQDLADRALIFNLPQIPEDARRPEKEFWADFEKVRPRILGALLDAVSMALRNQDSIKLPSLPRMADFAIWVAAAEPALPWPPGSFMAAYTGNRQEAVELSLEADCVAVVVRSLMADKEEWSGTPSELYEALKNHVAEGTQKSNAWPKAAHVLTGRLKRAATFLRAVGINIEFGKSGDRKTIITRRSVENSVQSAQPQENQWISPDASENSSVQSESGSVQDGNGGEILDASICDMDASQKVPSTGKADNHAGMGGLDATDASLHTLTADTERLLIWDEAMSQVAGAAVQALNPNEDLQEIAL